MKRSICSIVCANSMFLAALWLVGVSNAAQAAEFVDNFATGINADYWRTVITTPDLYTIDDSLGDVRFAKNAAVTSPGGFQGVRIGLKLAAIGGDVAGDFSTQVTFRDAHITGALFNQVQLEAIFADGSSFLDVFDNYGGPAIGINVHVWDGSNIRGAVSLPADTTGGELRINRSGAQLTGFFNDQPFFSLNKTSALTNVRLLLQNNHDNETIAVTFDDFSLTAANIVPEPSTSAVSLAFAGSVGLFRRSSRRRPARRKTACGSIYNGFLSG